MIGENSPPHFMNGHDVTVYMLCYFEMRTVFQVVGKYSWNAGIHYMEVTSILQMESTLQHFGTIAEFSSQKSTAARLDSSLVYSP